MTVLCLGLGSSCKSGYGTSEEEEDPAISKHNHSAKDLQKPLFREKSGKAASLNKHGAKLRLKETVDRLEDSILPPDASTYASLLIHCGNVKALADGKRVHAHMARVSFDRQTYLGNHLVQMYGKCGCLREAQSVFESIWKPNVFSWNIMVVAYIENGQLEKAISMFDNMPERDVVSWNAILAAFAKNGQLQNAVYMFQEMPERDKVSWNAMIAAFAAAGHVEGAKNLFDKMPERDIVSWNAVITAYAQNGYGRRGLELFRCLILDGLEPNIITFVSALDCCSSIAAMEDGQGIHAMAVASGAWADVVVGTALVKMYGKCGSLENARYVFDKMPKRDLVAWNAMIASYGHTGHSDKCLELFSFLGLEGVHPDDITFLSVLSACSHRGMLRDGWSYFVSMRLDYGLVQSVDHYLCMIDLLGRAGKLDDVEELINGMPFEPDFVAWMILLGACRVHGGNVEQAARAAEHIYEMEPTHGAPRTLLLQMAAETRRNSQD